MELSDPQNAVKIILVTGGVISGVGKGVITSSLGALLKANGYRVTAIKIDPYLNVDAGTFSPYEHGEVFVLDDGAEVDLDLGNYDRFLNVSLTRDNNITTGKIYQRVMSAEREGKYLGKREKPNSRNAYSCKKKTTQLVQKIPNSCKNFTQLVQKMIN